METVKVSNPEYPNLLRQISNPPKELYYKGNWDDDLFSSCLAVVGSRQMTNYGKRITEQLVSKIASAGITIVSGFMYGVDAQAHKTALRAEGRTIAVMPCGIDLIHPEYQKNLYKEIIIKGGLIISELEGDFLPKVWTYPRRNRIMVGLSQATLVIEAGPRSGSLITANLTRKYGRRLFAVPGPLTSSLSRGTLQLIREGADMVISANDVLASYGLMPSECSTSSVSDSGLNLNKIERSITEKLTQEPREIDALSRIMNLSASELGAALSLMQLRGLICKEEGKYYLNSSA